MVNVILIVYLRVLQNLICIAILIVLWIAVRSGSGPKSIHISVGR